MNVNSIIIEHVNKLVSKYLGQSQTSNSNDPLRLRISDTVQEFLDFTVQAGLMHSASFVCDDNNNTALTVADHELHYTVVLDSLKADFILGPGNKLYRQAV